MQPRALGSATVPVAPVGVSPTESPSFPSTLSTLRSAATEDGSLASVDVLPNPHSAFRISPAPVGTVRCAVRAPLRACPIPRSIFPLLHSTFRLLHFRPLVGTVRCAVRAPSRACPIPQSIFLLLHSTFCLLQFPFPGRDGALRRPRAVARLSHPAKHLPNPHSAFAVDRLPAPSIPLPWFMSFGCPPQRIDTRDKARGTWQTRVDEMPGQNGSDSQLVEVPKDGLARHI